MHDVPLAAFTADGLSVIASKIGNPVMLDSYTCTICNESWGRSSYARATIEIEADVALKESVTVAVPNIEGDGHTCEKVSVEYEWKPPHCMTCKTFCHAADACPLIVKEQPKKVVEEKNDGFQVAQGRNKGKKQVDKSFAVKPKTNLAFKQTPKPIMQGVWKRKNEGTKTFNPFSVLASTSGTNVEDVQTGGNVNQSNVEVRLELDEEDIEHVYDESIQYMASDGSKSVGASTPNINVPNV